MKASFAFSWRGVSYAYSRGEYYADGKPTGQSTLKGAKDSLASGPRSAESLKILQEKRKTGLDR